MSFSAKMDQDVFKEEFKKFKRKKTPLSLKDVLDFNSPKTFAEIEERVLPAAQDAGRQLNRTCLECGLKPFSEWRVFCLRSFPGWQREWVRRCVCCYTNKPNVCNLDAHMDRPNTSLWDDYVAKDPRARHETLMHCLRWVTLGYHYDWTSKTYAADKHSKFPEDLAELCSCLAEVLALEAGIVNFYHLDSTLSGHTDHSEFDLTAPLFSISFGLEAIFLLGGNSRSIRPAAMFVRSGDIMIMSGPSRMAYHAVPRVLAPPKDGDKLPECFCGVEQVPDDKWRALAIYLSTSRINVNVRQVLKPGSLFPYELVSANAEHCEGSQEDFPEAGQTSLGSAQGEHTGDSTVLSLSEEKIPCDTEDYTTIGAAKKRCIS